VHGRMTDGSVETGSLAESPLQLVHVDGELRSCGHRPEIIGTRDQQYIRAIHTVDQFYATGRHSLQGVANIGRVSELSGQRCHLLTKKLSMLAIIHGCDPVARP
jgi:hypothetical protein